MNDPTPVPSTKLALAHPIFGFSEPTQVFNAAQLEALNAVLTRACQNAKTNLASAQARLNADLINAQSLNQQATALYQQAEADFEAGIVATPENSTDFQNCLNAINFGCTIIASGTKLPGASQLQAAYASAFSDALSAYNDITTILASPILLCDLSAYSSSQSLTTLNTITSLGSIFAGLAGLAGLATAKLTPPPTPPAASQVVQCMTINVTPYGFDEVLNQTCTQQLISWLQANIGTGPQDLITQLESALGKIPVIGSVVTSILDQLTGNIFYIASAIEKLNKGNGITIHNSVLALVVPLYSEMTTANLQNEASGTSGGVPYEDAIWVTAN